MDFLNAGPWLASLWLHSRRAKGNANSNTFILTFPRFISKAKFWILAKPSIFQVALLFSQMSQDLVGEKMETDRFYDAVNVILSLQVRIRPCRIFFFFFFWQIYIKYKLCVNYIIHFTYLTFLGLMILKWILIIGSLLIPIQSSNGGFPAWEPQRAYRWLEVTSPINLLVST